MDSKITLSFDAAVIEKARTYAESKNISLSRLTEYLLRKVSDANFETLESLPISDWVKDLTLGSPTYVHKPKVSLHKNYEYYESKLDSFAVNEPEVSYIKTAPKVSKKKK